MTCAIPRILHLALTSQTISSDAMMREALANLSEENVGRCALACGMEMIKPKSVDKRDERDDFKFIARSLSVNEGEDCLKARPKKIANANCGPRNEW